MRISDWSSDVCSSDLCAEGEKATNIGWYAVCDTARGRFGARKEVTNEIVVAFTGMPEQEVAGSIWRRTVFAVGKYPTVASVIDALTQKYGEPHIGQTESGYYSMSHRTGATNLRSEEHTSELQSLMRISYDVFC